MQELGTIDMFHSLSPDRLVAARRMAVEAGALAMAAIVDLQLAALYEARGEVGPDARDRPALRGGVPPVGPVDPADGDPRAGVRARPAGRPARRGGRHRGGAGHR